MKGIAALGGVCAAVYTALTVRSIGQIWVLPVAFLVFCVLWALAYWLFLGVYSLHIRMGRSYDRPSAVDYRLLNSGYRFLCSAARVRVHVTGLEKVPSDRRFLLVSNHLSRFDPMVQSIVLNHTPLAFISKLSNFTVPIGRRYITRCCYMAIDRESPRNAMKTIRRATELIATDTVSVAVYPEGHRGTGAALQEFKHGCLRVAVKADCPIVVTTIDGTQDIHRRFPWRRTDVYVDILDVIQPEHRKTVDLSAQIREEMQAHLQRKDEPR